MPTVNKKLLLTTTTTPTAVAVGCGGGCRRLKLSKIFHPKHHRRHHHHRHHHQRHHSSTTTTSCNTTPSSSSSTTTTTTAVTFSPESTAGDSDVRAVQGFGRIGGNSLAVEKDSDDPYVDFRDSMLQMIMEKQIYDRDDLRELLNCFLQLNSPYYHGIIIRAFTEIWNNVVCVKLMHGDHHS